ncbi:MAG: hypothetical protein WAU42_08340 [Solirubrobacteraceae bacterium]
MVADHIRRNHWLRIRVLYPRSQQADVVGGTLTAGKVAVPWAVFRQATAAGGHDQTFVRSFAEGAWSTRGNGTPFFLFTGGTTPLSLFADAYQPDAPVTEGASAVGSSTAIVHAAVEEHGASASVSFQYGATAAYGASTGAQTLVPGSAPTPFSAQLSGLATATTIHYRAVASSDFGTFFGADETLTTTTPATASTTVPPGVLLRPPGVTLGKATASNPTISGTTARVRVSCSGLASATCQVTLKLIVTEKFKSHRLVAVTAATKAHKTRKLLVVGSASVLLKPGHTQIVRIGLNRTGKQLLARRHTLKATLRVTAATSTAIPASILTRVVTFKSEARQ